MPQGGGMPPGGMAQASGSSVGPGIAPPNEVLQLPNRANAWDDETPSDAFFWSNYSSITVDLLWLNTSFHGGVPAYSSTQANPGTSNFVTPQFDYNRYNVVPRVNLDVRIGDYWGVRGSWMQFERSAPTLATTNSNPNAVVLSPPLIDGYIRGTQSDQILIGNVFLKNVTTNVVIPSAAQVRSPRAFLFLNLVPRNTLLPPNQGAPLPPFTLKNAVQAGFPDDLTFSSSFRVEVADMDLTRSIEFARSNGVMGLGVRYGHISHSYSASRVNRGGNSIIPGYDPFINLIQDAVIFTNEDSEYVNYGSTFGGAGPKFSLDIGTEISRFARLYAKGNASVLMGNRKEIAFYKAAQRVTITDVNLQLGQQQSDIFYNQIFAPQIVAERNIFTVIPVGEAEIGIEIAMGGRLSPVFRAGAFGQAWINGGNPTNPNANLFIYGLNATLGIGF